MAGRGIRITVYMDSAQNESIEVDLARHTPLRFLKTDLAERTGVCRHVRATFTTCSDCVTFGCANTSSELRSVKSWS